MPRLDHYDARALCSVYGIDPSLDFHTMPTAMVDAVLAAADSRGYKKPKNASGSRGRYFAEYLRRTLERGRNVRA